MLLLLVRAAPSLAAPANKSLQATLVNVAKIHEYSHFSRVVERVLTSWSAPEFKRSALS